MMISHDIPWYPMIITLRESPVTMRPKLLPSKSRSSTSASAWQWPSEQIGIAWTLAFLNGSPVINKGSTRRTGGKQTLKVYLVENWRETGNGNRLHWKRLPWMGTGTCGTGLRNCSSPFWAVVLSTSVDILDGLIWLDTSSGNVWASWAPKTWPAQETKGCKQKLKQREATMSWVGISCTIPKKRHTDTWWYM